MCTYWSDPLKQVGIFYATWPEHSLKHTVSKTLLFLSLGSTLLLSCGRAGITGTRCVRVTKTTPRFNGLLGELPGLRKSSYLWLGFITANVHEAKSGKGKARGAESEEIRHKLWSLCLPVESEKMYLVPPVMSCDDTCKMYSRWKPSAREAY